MDTSVKLTSAKDDEALADREEYDSIGGGLMFAACKISLAHPNTYLQ